VTDKNRVLHIDIPVVLDQIKAVFSVASLSFEKDLPAALFHIGLIVNDVADWNAEADIVAVFHTNAGHVTLHDDAYNKERDITTGNPYKTLVTDLMKKGVRVELCGATAEAYGWINTDTIPGIKINTDAMSRLVQLVQQGFVKVSES
jgi:intracellular sulfur oxidation DsrE/DsrF family protein